VCDIGRATRISSRKTRIDARSQKLRLQVA
jgi:hypothetical protein